VTRLADLVALSARVAGTSSRLAKVREIAALLRRLDPDEIEIAIPHLSGELRQGKLVLGYATLHSVKGNPASAPNLTIREIDSAFQDLKSVKGKGAAAVRHAQLKQLFDKATAEEQDFLLRLIAGELRQGALEGVLQEAVASAAGLPAEALRRAATFAGALAPVARAALEGKGISQFSVEVMQPVQPMLAQPAADIAAALATLGTALLEWKLDGARVQVHKSGDEVRVYSRNLNDVTAAVPEVKQAVKGAKAQSLILDGEAIALRPDARPYPFQVTMRRFGRKLDVDALRGELPLSVFFFDCLLHDGKVLVDLGALERRRLLAAAVHAQFVTPALVTGDGAEAEAFYRDALAHGHEGVMAKAPAAPYAAGRRGAGWLKIKSAKTLDLVVLAAEWGSGRRRGWLSNLHLGAREPQAGTFIMLGKTFKGLTDETLEWQTRQFLSRETRRDEWTVYVRPELVVEIAFNDIQESPQYPAGLALRFARVKGYRPDKRAADADTIETVRRLYEAGIA
jgi:ATP-dependent DNA ligase I